MSVFISLALFILDRLTKWFILKNQDLYLGKLFEFKFSKNQNLFFLSFDQPLLLVLTGATLLTLFVPLLITLSKKNYLSANRVSLILLGGLSNFFDRLVFGYVIDWINVSFLPFFSFNLADLMITTGLLCVVINVFDKK